MKNKALGFLCLVFLCALDGSVRADGWSDLSGQADAPRVVAFNDSKNHPGSLPFIPQRKLEAGFWTAFKEPKVIEKIGQTTVKSDAAVVWKETGLWMHLLVGTSWVSLPVFEGAQASAGAVKAGSVYYGLHPAFWKSLQATRPPAKKAGTPTETVKTGGFTVNLGEFNGTAQTPDDRKANPFYDYNGDPAKEEANVVVPRDYDGTKPYGLMVFISPSMDGSNGLGKSWSEDLAARHIIWIGPKNDGNNHTGDRRVWLAQHSRAWALHHYKIDPARMIISGFSGGADSASATSVATPFGFNSAILFAPPSGPPTAVVRVPREAPGIPITEIKPLSGAGLSHIKREWRIAYIVGVQDNFLKYVHASMEAVKGFEQGSKLFEIAGMGHGTPSSIKDVLEFIDAPRETGGGKSSSGFSPDSYLAEIRGNLVINPERARSTMAQLWQNHPEAHANADVLAMLAKMEALP